MKRVNLLPGIATSVAVTIRSGCYPSFLTSRPEAEIIVTDESGAPLGGATVTLATREWHGIGGQNTFEKFSTDHEGRVEFGKQHVWAMQVMLPDGGTSYTWFCCWALAWQRLRHGRPRVLSADRQCATAQVDH